MEHKYEPLNFDGRYLWHNRDHPLTYVGDHADHLPESVFRNLRGYIVNGNVVTSRVRAYPSRQSAMDALADALQRRE